MTDYQTAIVILCNLCEINGLGDLIPWLRMRFSDFAKEHCPLDGEKIRITEVFNKSSTVLVEQIETYKGELPFVAIIKQVGKFYTFT